MISLPNLAELAPWVIAFLLAIALIAALVNKLPETIKASSEARSGEFKRRNDLRKIVDELVAERLKDREAILGLTLELKRTQADLQTVVSFLATNASSQTKGSFRYLRGRLMTIDLPTDMDSA